MTWRAASEYDTPRHVIHRVVNPRFLSHLTRCDMVGGIYSGSGVGCTAGTHNAITGRAACTTGRSSCTAHPVADAVIMTSLAQSTTATTADACLCEKPFRRNAGFASTCSSPAAGAGATVRAGDPPAARAVARAARHGRPLVRAAPANARVVRHPSSAPRAARFRISAGAFSSDSSWCGCAG